MPFEARVAGAFRGKRHGWLLPIHLAEHNLLPTIRLSLLAQFEADHIAWHDGDHADYGDRAAPGPSPNLMDSQIACLNFWCGLAAASPAALLEVVRMFAPEAERLVAPVARGPLVQAEWMGLRNYLGERGQRRRGQYATSANLLLAWEESDGVRHGALLESKYSEAYDARSRRFSQRGTDRASIYAGAAMQSWSPLVDGVEVGELMVEPFDQHLRQQLLAAAMEAHGELELTTVRLVHVAPRANRAFHEGVTAPALHGAGKTVAEAWSTVLRRPERYVSVAYEDLFARACDQAGAAAWADALRARYGWAS